MICLLVGVSIVGLSALFTRGVTYGTQLSAVSNVPDKPYGVNVELDKIVDEADLQRSIDLIAAGGFRFIRQVFAWNELEISAKGDFYDHKNGKSAWDKYDRIVDKANAAGLQVIARLERPPDWARPPGTTETNPPANDDDYGDFVAAFVQHYGSRVPYIQIWNEPNRFEDWGSQPVDPAAYTRLLKIGYARAKQVNPGVSVLSAALTPTTDCCTKNRPDPLYLQQMYDAGARGSFDILGAQAYGLRSGPEDPWTDLPLYPDSARKTVIDSHNTNFGRVVLDRDVMVRNGDAGKSVWVGEFGWNALPVGWSGDPSPWGSVSLQQQADYTVEAYQRAQREWPWLGVMNLWLFQDPSPAVDDPTQFFGLVDPNFQPRPVYRAVQQLAQQPSSAAPGVSNDQAMSTSGPWTPAPGGIRQSPVSGATATLRFEGNAVDLETVRAADRGIAYVTVDGSPTYATEVPKDSAGRAAIDLFAPGQATAMVPVARGLPYGAHEVTVTVSGLQNPRSNGPAVEVDGFQPGLTRDQRPYYAGGLLAGLGVLVMGWKALWLVGRRSFALGASLGGRETLRSTLRVTGESSLVLIAAVIPFYLQPIHVRSVEVPLSEALIGLTLAGYLLWTAVAGCWSWPKSSLLWPAGLFFVAASASVMAADYPRYALREWRTDVIEPLLFFGLILVLRPRVRPLLHGLLLGGLVVTLAGFVQYAHSRGIQAEGVLRMVGVYRSPDNFALYLGRLVPIAAALALLAPVRPIWRALYGVVAAAGVVAVLLSFTRGGWLGVLVALLVVGGFAGRRWLAAGVFGGALAAALLSVVQAQRIRSIFQLTPGSTGFTRIELWRSTVRMIGDHPVFGVGLDNFLYQYPRYVLPQARNEPDLSHPHDLFLDFWSRIGIFGLASLVWLEAVFFRKARNVLRTAKGFEFAAAVGLVASMVDCLVHGLVDNSYFLVDLSLLFWLTLGVMQLLEWGSPRREETAT